jgi:hypothetical protein
VVVAVVYLAGAAIVSLVGEMTTISLATLALACAIAGWALRSDATNRR